MKTIELPKLIFYTVGLPGSGKTELSVNLQGHTNVEHVSTDKIGINIFGFLRFYKPEERDLVYKEALYQVEGLIWDNKPVVYDANANTVSSREGLRALAKNNQVPLIAIYVKTPLELAKVRAQTSRRDVVGNVVRVVTPEQFDEKVREFEEPKDEPYIIQVSGTDSFSKQFKAIQDNLAKLKIQ